MDEHVTMANLMHTLDTFIRELFGEEMQTRYRPHYFPLRNPAVKWTCPALNVRVKDALNVTTQAGAWSY